MLSADEFRDLAITCDTMAEQAHTVGRLYEAAAEQCNEQARKIDARLTELEALR